MINYEDNLEDKTSYKVFLQSYPTTFEPHETGLLFMDIPYDQESMSFYTEKTLNQLNEPLDLDQLVTS